MFKIASQRLPELFAAVAAEQTLYLPVDTETGAKFEKWEEGKTLSNALNTVRSPKDFYLPKTKNLLNLKT